MMAKAHLREKSRQVALMTKELTANSSEKKEQSTDNVVQRL